MIERANGTIKELIQKSLKLNEDFDWAKNLQILIGHINNTNHRITRFTPNQIQEAYENDDKEILDEAFDRKLKKNTATHHKKFSKTRYGKNIFTK